MRLLSCCLLSSLLLLGCGDDAEVRTDAGVPFDQCVSVEDRAIIEPYLVDGGTGLSDALNDLLRGCAELSCSGELIGGTQEEAEACMSACYATTAIADLSQGCQDCWTLSSICGADYCAVPCLGTEPDMCTECVNANCTPTRDYCTGL